MKQGNDPSIFGKYADMYSKRRDKRLAAKRKRRKEKKEIKQSVDAPTDKA